MASLVVDGSTLVVRLSGLERLGACKLHDPTVPLSSVRSVRVSPDPWRDMRGLRAPGTGIPGVIMLGTTRWKGVRDFDAVYRKRPGVVVELEGAPYGRFVVTTEDPERVAAGLSAAAGL